VQLVGRAWLRMRRFEPSAASKRWAALAAPSNAAALAQAPSRQSASWFLHSPAPSGTLRRAWQAAGRGASQRQRGGSAVKVRRQCSNSPRMERQGAALRCPKPASRTCVLEQAHARRAQQLRRDTRKGRPARDRAHGRARAVEVEALQEAQGIGAGVLDQPQRFRSALHRGRVDTGAQHAHAAGRGRARGRVRALRRVPEGRLCARSLCCRAATKACGACARTAGASHALRAQAGVRTGGAAPAACAPPLCPPPPAACPPRSPAAGSAA
jgi:hypothetical protein